MINVPVVPVLLANLPEHPSLWQDVEFQLVGMIVVFSALTAIWLSMEAIGAGFRRWGRPEHPVHHAAPTPAPEAAASPSPETVALIAAAVHSSMGPSHRIVSISPAGAPPLSWGVEGRREHASSHRIR